MKSCKKRDVRKKVIQNQRVTQRKHDNLMKKYIDLGKQQVIIPKEVRDDAGI